MLALAYHLDLDFELAVVNLFGGGNKTPASRALNPNEKMPREPGAFDRMLVLDRGKNPA